MLSDRSQMVASCRTSSSPARPTAGLVVGDLASLAQCRSIAEQADALGSFDAVIHNAAVGFREKRRVLTEDGLPRVLAVNTLAPFVLTARMRKPKRLIFISSELHRKRGDPSLQDITWERRAWQGNQAYSDTKLHVVLLALAFARRWPDVLSNALEPGWVATKMGGPNATGDLDQAHRTQAWLAVSDAPEAMGSGRYFFHGRTRAPHPATGQIERQDALLALCQTLSGCAL